MPPTRQSRYLRLWAKVFFCQSRSKQKLSRQVATYQLTHQSALGRLCRTGHSAVFDQIAKSSNIKRIDAYQPPSCIRDSIH